MARVVLDDDPPVRRRAVIDDGEPSPKPTRTRVMLTADNDVRESISASGGARARERERRDDDPEPVSSTASEIISRFKAPIDPFDRDYPSLVPADIARMASRFTHEAVAALRLEIHHKTGRARSHAATQLLALAMHSPEAAVIEAVETLSDEALDKQLTEAFKGTDGDEMMATYGFIRARTPAELSKVRAIVGLARQGKVA
jgi:hypothetical protein